MTIPKEFECPICLNLLYRPVTTSCGHNFCKHCIDRTLFVTRNCPICKLELTNDYSPNLLLVQIINERFPEEINAIQSFTVPQDQESQDSTNAQEQGSPRRIPVYYRRTLDPPIVHGSYTLRIRSLSQYRRVQCALASDRKLLVCRKRLKFIHPIASLVRITSNNIPEVDDRVPDFPVTMVVEFVERVRIFPPPHIKPINYPDCSYVPYKDLWSTSSSDESDLDRSQKNREIFNQIHEISDNLNTLCRDFDSINDVISTFKRLNSELTGYNRYYSCIILINSCIILLKRQLLNGQLSLRTRFESLYGPLPVLSDHNPPVKELERLSLYLLNVVLATTTVKWNWFSFNDTFDRLLGIAELIVLSRDKNVIKLGGIMIFHDIISSLDPLVTGVIFLIILLISPKLYRMVRYRNRG